MSCFRQRSYLRTPNDVRYIEGVFRDRRIPGNIRGCIKHKMKNLNCCLLYFPDLSYQAPLYFHLFHLDNLPIPRYRNDCQDSFMGALVHNVMSGRFLSNHLSVKIIIYYYFHSSSNSWLTNEI